MSEITASVVLYKTPESQLTRLLDCIARSSVQVNTYLIDNSPAPIDLPCFRVPDIIYIRAKANKGYGAGHNIALRAILDSSEFHFVLNPDIYFEPTELGKMIQFMRQDSAIGQLMPRVIYPDGSLQYLCKLLPTPADLFFRRFSFGLLKNFALRRNERYELRHTNYDQVMDIPNLSGCFMLLRTAALRRVGLFDERFFMYLEDFDLTRRVHAEFRTVFFPGATVLHDHARASYRSAQALWTHTRSAVRYFNKWGWLSDSQRSKFNREALGRIEQPMNGHAAPIHTPRLLAEKINGICEQVEKDTAES